MVGMLWLGSQYAQLAQRLLRHLEPLAPEHRAPERAQGQAAPNSSDRKSAGAQACRLPPIAAPSSLGSLGFDVAGTMTAGAVVVHRARMGGGALARAGCRGPRRRLTRRGHLLRDGPLPAPAGPGNVDVVIVGAGVSGLSAAWRLASLGLCRGARARAQHRRHQRWGSDGVVNTRGVLPAGPERRSPATLRRRVDGCITGWDGEGKPRFDSRVLAMPEGALFFRGAWHSGPRDDARCERARRADAFSDIVEGYNERRGNDGAISSRSHAPSSRDPRRWRSTSMSAAQRRLHERFSEVARALRHPRRLRRGRTTFCLGGLHCCRTQAAHRAARRQPLPRLAEGAFAWWRYAGTAWRSMPWRLSRRHGRGSPSLPGRSDRRTRSLRCRAAVIAPAFIARL
jgi:hypothetical protein